MTEISQDALDKECQHAKLRIPTEDEFSRQHAIEIICTHDLARKNHREDNYLCVACSIHCDDAQYGPIYTHNYLPAMNSCEYKIPLTPDKERHIKRLYDQDMIYTKAIRMQEKIDSRETDDIVLKDDKDIEGMIALTIVNYLKSNDYYTKNFKERLQAREDIKRKIETIAQNIEKTLEARM